MDTQVDFAVVRKVSPGGARAGHKTKASPRLGQSMLYRWLGVCVYGCGCAGHSEHYKESESKQDLSTVTLDMNHKTRTEV